MGAEVPRLSISPPEWVPGFFRSPFLGVALGSLVVELDEVQSRQVDSKSMWQVIWSTVLSEFSEITDLSHFIRIIFRIMLAAILGGLLGYDRELKGRTAGLRTHMLVSLGAALFVLIPQQAGATVADLTNVMHGLAAGVGFLGAGSIIMGSRQEETKGMTTAASIWLTAAIGVASGMGREVTAILSTLLALVILSFIPKVERLFEIRGKRSQSKLR